MLVMQMDKISLNEFDLLNIDIFRIALSEETREQRMRAIINSKHNVVEARIEVTFNTLGDRWTSDLTNAKFMSWVATTSARRTDAAYEFAETERRFYSKNERKINIAEETGFLIFRSVQTKRFKGVQTKGGLLEQIRHVARQENVRGAKDKDVVRKIWKTYRGVVHLGMAITYCEENPDQQFNILHLAELFRETLSGNCPKGRSEPYVDPSSQISFVYLSKLWGPRFGSRGLSYDVD